MRELHINPRLTRRNNGIDRYFSEIGGHQKVSANEEVELAKRIQAGDRAALEILVKANLRFVISVAKQYSTNPELLQDLISQGNIGLTEASYTFDHTRGFKFISYAVWHIRKEILKYLNESLKTVKLPNNVTLDLSRARKIEAKMSTALGRDPSTEEVVAEMKRQGWNTTVERIEYCRKVAEGSTPFESTDPEEDHSPSKWISSGDSATALLDRSESTAMMRRL